MNWIALLFSIAIAAQAADLPLRNGRVLKDCRIAGGDKTRVHIQHAAGIAWYTLDELSDDARAAVATNADYTASLPPDRPTAEEISWTARLRKDYSVDADGRLQSGTRVNGKVLNVLKDYLLIATENGGVVAVYGVATAGYVDDMPFDQLTRKIDRKQYTSVQGTVKTVWGVEVLPQLTADDVHRLGLETFPEYRSHMAWQREQDARRIAESKAALQRAREADDRAMDEAAKKVAEGQRALRQANRDAVMGVSRRTSSKPASSETHDGDLFGSR